MRMELKLKLFKLVAKLPENRLTMPLKKKVDAALDVEVAAMKQDILRRNWDNVRLHQEIRRLLAEEDVPEEKREKLEEMDRKVVELMDGMSGLVKRLEEDEDEDEEPG